MDKKVGRTTSDSLFDRLLKVCEADNAKAERKQFIQMCDENGYDTDTLQDMISFDDAAFQYEFKDEIRSFFQEYRGTHQCSIVSSIYFSQILIRPRSRSVIEKRHQSLHRRRQSALSTHYSTMNM